MTWRSTLAVLLLALTLAAPAGAIEPQEQLADPALEARARTISQELRCPVCQNESIDDSNADLARDLRRIVRERLTAGDTDDQVVGFITARYGDYVLLRPPLRDGTQGENITLSLADKIRKWRHEGRDCYVFFDNDALGHAPHDALRLAGRLRGPANVVRSRPPG